MVVMTVIWLDPAHAAPAGRRSLRLVGGVEDGVLESPWEDPAPGRPPLVLVPDRSRVRAGRHRTSPAVRRRRTLLAAMGLLLAVLALPLSGTGGYSHPAGSALAETGRPVVYTVRPGDSLWSIARRADPGGDPRPLVAMMAARTGSESVQPGERIVIP